MPTVLVSQSYCWKQSTSIGWLTNELLLMVIGQAIAILLIYIMRSKENTINKV